MAGTPKNQLRLLSNSPFIYKQTELCYITTPFVLLVFKLVKEIVMSFMILLIEFFVLTLMKT